MPKFFKGSAVNQDIFTCACGYRVETFSGDRTKAEKRIDLLVRLHRKVCKAPPETMNTKEYTTAKNDLHPANVPPLRSFGERSVFELVLTDFKSEVIVAPHKTVPQHTLVETKTTRTDNPRVSGK